MKSIKSFKYINTKQFNVFLEECNYKLKDIFGFESSWKEQYHGNILKEYTIFFKNGEYKHFKVVYFKSLNECQQSRLGFNGERLLEWYQDANVVWYKVKDIYGMHDRYVITAK